MITTGGVRPGDSAVVFGLGGVGLSAVMNAALTNTHPLIAVDPVPAKRELAIALGATAAFGPDEAEQAVKESCSSTSAWWPAPPEPSPPASGPLMRP